MTRPQLLENDEDQGHLSARRRLLITALVCLTPIVSHSFGRSVYGLLLPAIEEDLGIGHGVAGIPGTGIYVLYVVGVLVVAALAPKVEPINIMRGALAIAITGIGIASIAPNILWLTIGVSMAGGAGAGIWMTAPVLATAYVSPARRGLVIGLLSSAIGLSNIALGIGTRGVRRSLDDDTLWRPVWVFALIFTIALLLGLIGIARFGKTERTSGGFNFDQLREVPMWARVTVAYALFGSMSAGFNAFILAALEDGGMSRSDTTVVFSLMGLALVVMSPTMGALSDRLGRPIVMSGCAFVLVVACLSVAGGTRTSVPIGAVLYASTSGAFPALIAAHIRDHVDNRLFSRVLATMTILFSLLAALSPGLVGWLADRTGDFTWSFLVLASLVFGAFVLTLGMRTTDAPAPVRGAPPRARTGA